MRSTSVLWERWKFEDAVVRLLAGGGKFLRAFEQRADLRFQFRLADLHLLGQADAAAGPLSRACSRSRCSADAVAFGLFEVSGRVSARRTAQVCESLGARQSAARAAVHGLLRFGGQLLKGLRRPSRRSPSRVSASDTAPLSNVVAARGQFRRAVFEFVSLRVAERFQFGALARPRERAQIVDVAAQAAFLFLDRVDGRGKFLYGFADARGVGRGPGRCGPVVSPACFSGLRSRPLRAQQAVRFALVPAAGHRNPPGRRLRRRA